MGFEFLYWHWLIFGMVLLILELVSFTFVILWFGVGALFVGVVLFFLPHLSVASQLFIWAMASGVLTFLWFKFFKPFMKDKTKAGIAREAILGEVGYVIKVPTSGQKGVVRFAMPILGADEWSFLCEDEVVLGDRVKVVEISGNSLVVVKVA